MDKLDELESESIFILREAYCKLGKIGMLWSIGKDSTVLLWLAKSFLRTHAVPVYPRRHAAKNSRDN